MSKRTVTKLFLGGARAVIAGAIIAVAAVWVGVANDVFVMNGPDLVGLRGGALTWSLLALGIVASLAMAAGLIADLVSWIGALLNLSQLESKTWFVVLLVLGIFNFGIVGMLAYVIAGPNGTSEGTPRRTHALAGA